jgi:hypothetical protein
MKTTIKIPLDYLESFELAIDDVNLMFYNESGKMGLSIKRIVRNKANCHKICVTYTYINRPDIFWLGSAYHARLKTSLEKKTTESNIITS